MAQPTTGKKPGAGKAEGRLRAGIFEANERGFGFVRLDEAGKPDVFIPPARAGDALHGDRVEARVHEGGRDGRSWGEITKILERNSKPVIGRFTGEMVVPRDPRLRAWLRVHPADAGEAKPGDVVMAEITRWPLGRLPAWAKVVSVVGDDSDPGLESKIALRSRGFNEDFPTEVTKFAAKAPKQVRPEDLKNRRDLRHVLTITIDPETARDFDDALAIEKLDLGFKVWVSIADVSHYVPSGSALDREAYERSTSVYFPDRAIPMLPSELSSGICSLLPEEDRLAMTVEMEFDEHGKRLACSYYTSVIRSDFRLTYDQVEEMERDRGRRSRFAEVWPRILLLKNLAEKRRKQRAARGAIDLDVPEAEVILDAQGEVSTILRRTQTWSHKLVEEFMLSANEAVAEYLTDRRQPMIYRVHEPPATASVLALADLLAPLGFQLLNAGAEPEHIRPRDYQRMIKAAAGHRYEMMVKTLCLRSMMQAHYSALLAGHFGLASERYCHFTSPIRRYPDLAVHRALKTMMGHGPTGAPAPQDLAKAAAHCSERERAATDAEREMVDLYGARWASGHLGEEFEGVVAGVTYFGIFVELQTVFVEGLVPREMLPKEADYDEDEMVMRERGGGAEYRIGDPVRVRLHSVDLERRRINFILLDKLKGR